MDKGIHVLDKHLPAGTAPAIYEKLEAGKVFLRITRKRASKLGDFRPATRTMPHRISVNHDLNPYEFLFTLLHELAHHEAYVRYGRRHKPHGPEWRAIFGDLVKPYLGQNIFPPDLEQGIIEHFSKAGITDCSDSKLRDLFKRYDPQPEPGSASTLPTIDMIPLNCRFAIPDGRQFIKLAIRRKRFSCYCYTDKRMYVFGPKVHVMVLDQEGKPVI
ncbi:MAG TPA: SprT-like domain-containing protein [Bacteroidales bacterium]|nr:SprT-like domain-containing protein [Bacteroidales bacterium]